MSWFVYSILAAVLWGVGQVAIKRGFTYVSPALTYAIDTIFALLIILPFAILNGASLSISKFVLFIIFAAKLISPIYYYAAQKGQIALTGTLLATTPVFTVILAALLLGEMTTLLQKIFITVIILGTILVATPRKINKKNLFRFENWVYWGILGAILIAVDDVAYKFAIDRSGIYTFLFYAVLLQVIVAFTLLVFDKRGRKFPSGPKEKFLPTTVGAGMMLTAWLFFLMGLATGQISLVSPVASSYQAITVVLGVIFLKETMTRLQAVGVALAILGIIGVSAV